MDTCTVEIDRQTYTFRYFPTTSAQQQKKQQNPQSPALASAIASLRFELA